MSQLCLVCDSDALITIDGYERLPRVTSDCRPWPAGGSLAVCEACGTIQKPPTKELQDEARAIYKSYALYQLSGGVEQSIFNLDGDAAPRSEWLADVVLKHCDLPRSGRLLDIGCGTGAALRSFGSRLPEWSLFGSELDPRALSELRGLSNFQRLFCDGLDNIQDRFDLVTMIHSLEHMTAPRTTLDEARNLLVAGGSLMVQVPNAAESLFDTLIADHVVHFSPAQLGFAAAKSGLRPIVLRDDLLPKEITLIAEPGDAPIQHPDPQIGIRLAKAVVGWLETVLDAGREAARQAAAVGRPFGVFGTANSGVWLFESLKDDATFFVDEDPARVGAQLDGQPVVSPGDVPEDASVYIPLTPPIARRIQQRLGDGPATYLTPPDLPIALA